MWHHRHVFERERKNVVQPFQAVVHLVSTHDVGHHKNLFGLPLDAVVASVMVGAVVVVLKISN